MIIITIVLGNLRFNRVKDPNLNSLTQYISICMPFSHPMVSKNN